VPADEYFHKIRFGAKFYRFSFFISILITTFKIEFVNYPLTHIPQAPSQLPSGAQAKRRIRWAAEAGTTLAQATPEHFSDICPITPALSSGKWQRSGGRRRHDGASLGAVVTSGTKTLNSRPAISADERAKDREAGEDD
jgi:hypothetical protein